MANATPEKAASNNHIPLTPTVKITQMIMRFLLLSKSTLLLIILVNSIKLMIRKKQRVRKMISFLNKLNHLLKMKHISGTSSRNKFHSYL